MHVLLASLDVELSVVYNYPFIADINGSTSEAPDSDNTTDDSDTTANSA